MRGPPGPETMRAGQEVLLVNRFQEHQDGPLRHLVLEGRDAERPLRAVRFRDVVPANRRCHIAARLDPAQQALKVGLQFPLVVGCRLAVDPRRPILPRPAERLPQPVPVEQVVQGREHPLRVLPRLFGYPLLFRERVCGTHGFLQRFPSVILSM